MNLRTERIDALFPQWDKKDSPGCALGIIKGGRFVYKRGYGMSDLEHDVPISSTSVFRIASTSKQFTAMCVALLAEDGLFSLDDNIRNYLPEMPEYKRPITIRHLIHHTSGIRDYLELMELAGMRDDDYYDSDEVLKLLSRQKELNFLPGDEFLYSNSGYLLLAMIVERVSGQSLREFAAERIFNPLGMENTHFHDNHHEIVKNRTIGYSPTEKGYRINTTSLDIVGDGGIFTTIEDLLRWDQNFYHNKLGQGNQELIDQILTPGMLNNSKTLDYAFGLMVNNYRGLKLVSHAGAFAGFRAEMIRFPEQGFSVICLTNLSSINPSLLARQVADFYLTDQFTKKTPSRKKMAKLISQELNEKAGIYWSPTTNMVVKISVHQDRLVADVLSSTFELSPISSTDFCTLDEPPTARIRFEKQEQNKPFLMCLSITHAQSDILQAIKPIAPKIVELAKYAGEYYSKELQAVYNFIVKDNKLYVSYGHISLNALEIVTNSTFKTRSAVIRFTDEDGSLMCIVNTSRVKNIKFIKLKYSGRTGGGEPSAGEGSEKEESA